MSSIYNPTLTIEDHSETTAKVTVKYNVAQFPPEYWAGTVYYEEIQLIGDDPPFNPAPPSGTDIVVAVFPPKYIRNPPVVPPRFYFSRERVLIVAKAALNEDPGFTELGLPEPDEIFARITLIYAANAPYPFPPFFTEPRIAAVAQTNTVVGSW